MKIQELLDSLRNTAKPEGDGKIFVIGESKSDDYCSVLTNFSLKELVKVLVASYEGDEFMHTVLDAFRMCIDEINNRTLSNPIGTPANTKSSDSQASAAFLEALKDLPEYPAFADVTGEC